MKDFAKSIKTGNASLASRPDTEVAKEIYKEYLDSGKNKEKTISKLVEKHKPLSREFISGLLEEAIKSYSNIVKNDTPAEYAKRKPKIVGGNKKIGNAFSKGQVLGEEGSKQYVFGGEINGTYIVYRQPDGGTYSFSSEQEIKDWLRASKIGNTEAQELEKDVEKKDEEKVEDIEELKKTGNEASDDKFAFVMREFEEGKLKTPDGKVVTDPAQAKAIAYSESKKTENGLARARNAIKK